MKTRTQNERFLDPAGNPVEVWAFFVNGRIFGLTYTAYPQWTVTYKDFVLQEVA